MCACTSCLFVCFSSHHFVWCGGASLAAVDSEPEWLLREWRPLFIYDGTQGPGRQDSRQARQDKRKSSWASCSVSVSLVLCFLTAFSFIIPAALAVSAKSDSSAWIQFSADAAFSRMERLKRRFPMLEPEFLADVLTTSQEGESRPYRRIEIEMQGYVCVPVLSVWGTFRIIRGHRWPKTPACWGQPTWKCWCRGHFPKISHCPSES